MTRKGAARAATLVGMFFILTAQGPFGGCFGSGDFFDYLDELFGCYSPSSAAQQVPGQNLAVANQQHHRAQAPALFVINM